MSEPSALAVRALQLIVITSLIFLAGLSSCLSLWVMPLLMRAPPRIGAQQFGRTVKWGMQYLQTCSRTLAASLVITVFLVWRLEDLAEAQEWRTWATALAILVPVAPYEIYAIFRINDRIEEIRLELEGKEAEDFSVAQKAELGELLRNWQWRNWGRVACPLVAGLVPSVNEYHETDLRGTKAFSAKIRSSLCNAGIAYRGGGPSTLPGADRVRGNAGTKSKRIMSVWTCPAGRCTIPLNL